MSSNIRIQRNCAQCGNDFIAKTTVTQTCSDKCRKAAYKARKRNEKIETSNQQTFRIKVKPIEDLSGKPFLTVSEVALIINCSKRTAYRLISKGIFPGVANLSERLTRIKRTELEKLFEQFEPKPPHPVNYTISECYGLSEVRDKYHISDKALHEVIKRNEIPKIKEGRNTYIPKTLIDSLLS